MLKGIFRLAVVLTILSWIGTIGFHYYHLRSDEWRFYKHISPHLRGKYSDRLPTELDWPVYAAGEEFISLPPEERRAKAEDFYNSYIKGWESFYRLEGLREWIVETSQHTVEQARIVKGGWSGMEVSYRSFRPSGILVVPRLSYLLFGSTPLVIALIAALSANILAVIVIIAGRWVWLGFRPPAKETRS